MQAQLQLKRWSKYAESSIVDALNEGRTDFIDKRLCIHTQNNYKSWTEHSLGNLAEIAQRHPDSHMQKRAKEILQEYECYKRK